MGCIALDVQNVILDLERETDLVTEYTQGMLVRELSVTPAVPGVELLHEAPVARELALRLDAPVDRVLDRCAERGIAAGYPLSREYPEYEDGLLVAITERRTREQIDALADALGAAVAAEAVAV